jgi:hypothetical protein
MDTKEAVTILESRGWKIYHKNGKWAINHPIYGDMVSDWKTKNPLFSGRELVKFVRTDKRYYKSNVKKFSNGKDRSATRDAIKSENFDKIPQNARTKEEDPWCWD